MLPTVDYQTVIDEDVSDEAEGYRAAMEDWVDEIASLWDVLGKPVDEKRLNQYCKELEIVPFGLLKKGISYAKRNNTYSNVPPIGAIWEGVRKELAKLNLPPGTDVEDAIEKWSSRLFERAVYRFE
jgi:hypothetical protein